MSVKIEELVSLEDLQTKRNDAVKAIGELRDKFHSRGDKEKNQPGRWEGEEETAWNQTDVDIRAIDARMAELRNSDVMENRWAEINEAAKQADKAPKDINDPRQTKRIDSETRNLAFQGWCCSQMDGTTVGQRQLNAMKRVGLSPNKRGLDIQMMNDTEYRHLKRAATSVHPSMMRQAIEQRDMTLATTAGGDFVPEGFVRELEISMLAFMGTAQAGSVIRTQGGGDLPWPTMNDTGNKGELLAINVEAAEQDPTTGVVTFNAYKMSSKVIIVPYELLEDEDLSAQLPSILNAAIAERIGRIREQYQTTGTGSSEPAGIVVGSALGVTTAGATAITADEVISLEHSVDPAYRANAAYMMHDGIILAVRLLKDSQGQYLWRAGLEMGRPDSLNGRRLFTNQEMQATVATATKTMLFGDMSKFKIREVNSIRLYRLQERFRTQDQDAFVAFQRIDSKILDSGTDPIKHMLQA